MKLSHLFLGWVFLASVPGVLAHQASVSSLELKSRGDTLEGELRVRLRDADYALGLDSDRDGFLTQADLDRDELRIQRVFAELLRLGSKGRAKVLHFDPPWIDAESSPPQFLLSFRIPEVSPQEDLEVANHFLFDLDLEHRCEVRWESPEGTRVRLLEATQQRASFSPRGGLLSDAVRQRLGRGMAALRATWLGWILAWLLPWGLALGASRPGTRAWLPWAAGGLGFGFLALGFVPCWLAAVPPSQLGAETFFAWGSAFLGTALPAGLFWLRSRRIA